MHNDLWIPAYIALGSNLNQPLQQVRTAVEGLKTLPRSRFYTQSKWYRSQPLGPQDQPEFVNGVAAILTQLSAQELLTELKQLELKMGRDPNGQRWGARVIDMDLLVYGTQIIQSENLTVPHPGIAERTFVLIPLADIAPDLMIPRVGRVSDLAARIGGDGLIEIASEAK